MKLKTAFFTILTAVCMTLMFSCSAEEATDKLLGGCLSNISESQSVSEAAKAYSENPTDATCAAYKAALIDWYKGFKDCPYWEDGEYQETINDIKNNTCD